MTQPARTTESISRDNEAIRDIMHQIRELTVPDRATLAVGLIGHLATMMNRNQMTKLLGELEEQAERVQDVPPARQDDQDARSAQAMDRDGGRADWADARVPDNRSGKPGRRQRDLVGQAGRGEFRSGELV
jgi:hypothetical protein